MATLAPPRLKIHKRSSMDILRTFTRSVSDSYTTKKTLPPSPYSLAPPSPSVAAPPSTPTSTSTTSPSPSTPRHSHSLTHSRQPSGTSTPVSAHSFKSTLSSPSPATTTNKNPTTSLFNTSTLPLGRSDLEARLNESTLQLQRLADRVETLNEWIETDLITLSRLEKADRQDREREAQQEELEWRRRSGAEGEEERMRGLVRELSMTSLRPAPLVVAKDSPRPSSYTLARDTDNDAPKGDGKENQKGDRMRKRSSGSWGRKRSSAPAVAALTPQNESNDKGKPKMSTVLTELDERIRTVQRWKRDLERSIVWRREECWAIRDLLGMAREDEEDEDAADVHWGRERKWERGSGRVPRQREWECMLNERGGAGEHEDGKEKERRERVEEGKGKGKERRRRSGGRKSSG